MAKEIYSELNEAQKIIYTESMIGRAYPDFVFGNISNIYRVGENCVVKRLDGSEQRYAAEKIKFNYLKFIGREVSYFSCLGPNYRGPIPLTFKKNTYALLKGWNYAYKDSHKTPESKMQQLWIDSLNNLKSLENVKCFLENMNDDDPEENIIPDIKESLGHIIVPGESCSCQAFQKQLRHADEFKEEFYEEYEPNCKHLHWYDKFKIFQKRRTDLRNKLDGKNPMQIALWFYTPPDYNYGKGTFQIWWTRDGMYGDNWKPYKPLTQFEAWDYLDKMIENGFLPFEGSLFPKIKSKFYEKSIT